MPNRCQTDAHLNVLAARATCGPFRVHCFLNVSIGFSVIAVWFVLRILIYSKVCCSFYMAFHGIPIICKLIYLYIYMSLPI